MSRWLYAALQQMDAAGGDPDAVASLMPERSPLDLFLTITDFYGYQRLIPIARPRFVPDSRHRHALSFHHSSDDSNQFADDAVKGVKTTIQGKSPFPAVSGDR